MQHTFEHLGVILLVDYDPELPITFNSVRVLGEDYKPTGPDLTPLLHEVLLLEPVASGQVPEATRFLSLITEEIYANTPHSSGEALSGG